MFIVNIALLWLRMSYVLQVCLTLCPYSLESRPIGIKFYPTLAFLSPGSGYVESTLVALRTTTGLL
jgi:hypothetical protein